MKGTKALRNSKKGRLKRNETHHHRVQKREPKLQQGTSTAQGNRLYANWKTLFGEEESIPNFQFSSAKSSRYEI